MIPSASCTRRAAVSALLATAVSLGTGNTAWAQPEVTFTKHVAPIVFEHCSSCHRPDGVAPFSLLTYDDVSRHAEEIVAVTRARYMPPWKPEPGYVEFEGARRLSDIQIATIERWVRDGMREGDAANLPRAPGWSQGWQLGEPDLVVAMPEPYWLRADGGDVFRNFVVPIPTAMTRHVRAWEFQPGNARVVHHATLLIDATPSSRRRDDEDPEPGYDGLITVSAHAPDGYFLGWTPGQTPSVSPDGMAWRLEPASDLVMLLHLRPSGREELVQPRIGLFFTDRPPSRAPALLRLSRQDIDIPAGEANYAIGDSYRVPVDVEVHSVQPHAHYLAKEVKGFARLPDGTTRWLIYIKDWDFNWQDAYRYAAPVPIPAGSTIVMELTYDNSALNVRNPHDPPRRVTYGQKTTDEMGDLWLQIVPANPDDLDLLQAELRDKMVRDNIVGYENLVEQDPDNVALHDDLAILHSQAGNLDRAEGHFAESVRIKPDSAAAQYNHGTALLVRGDTDAAITRLRRALALQPDHWDAHNNLGIALQAQGLIDDAVTHYRQALRLQPDYSDAHYNLAGALDSLGERHEAIQHLRDALRLRPLWPAALAKLAWALATSGDADAAAVAEAVGLAQRAVELTRPENAAVLDVLATALAAAGEFQRAVGAAERALTLATAAGDEITATAVRERLELFRRGTSPADAARSAR